MQITETYAFLPREAVTRFLLGCTECQKHPRSPSPIAVLPTPSPSPTLPLLGLPTQQNQIPIPTAPIATKFLENDQPVYLDISNNIANEKTAIPKNLNVSTNQLTPVKILENNKKIQEYEYSEPVELDLSTNNKNSTDTVKAEATNTINNKINDVKVEVINERVHKPTNPLDVANLTSKDPPKNRKRLLENNFTYNQTHKLWSPLDDVKKEEDKDKKNNKINGQEIDFSMPITTTYLKYMRSLGCTDEDALKFESKNVSFYLEEFLHEAIRHYFY